jgi:phosphotransacetylase
MADEPQPGADPLIAAVDPARRLLRPEIHTHARGSLFRELLRPAAGQPPLTTAVVHPCDAVSLGGALRAAQAGLIVPLLVGPRARIERAARQAGLALDGVRLIDAPHSHAAAARGVELVRAGEAAAILKGSLHTDELMAEVVHPDTGLRTGRRISHVFVLDVPHYPKPLFVTDAAINIAPDLDTKRDIVQNAIDLCHALGIARPKVAILSAVETVNPKIASTLDAAALCKMADRGQISGGILDGPLAFDNAVSAEAARTKAIDSPVAGDADVLVAPDLESGNMMAKQLVYLADALIAGLVLGARVPIMLTSRADDELSRLASCALALLYRQYCAARVTRPGS